MPLQTLELSLHGNVRAVLFMSRLHCPHCHTPLSFPVTLCPSCCQSIPSAPDTDQSIGVVSLALGPTHTLDVPAVVSDSERNTLPSQSAWSTGEMGVYASEPLELPIEDDVNTAIASGASHDGVRMFSSEAFELPVEDDADTAIGPSHEMLGLGFSPATVQEEDAPTEAHIWVGSEGESTVMEEVRSSAELARVRSGEVLGETVQTPSMENLSDYSDDTVLSVVSLDMLSSFSKDRERHEATQEVTSFSKDRESHEATQEVTSFSKDRERHEATQEVTSAKPSDAFGRESEIDGQPCEPSQMDMTSERPLLDREQGEDTFSGLLVSLGMDKIKRDDLRERMEAGKGGHSHTLEQEGANIPSGVGIPAVEEVNMAEGGESLSSLAGDSASRRPMALRMQSVGSMDGLPGLSQPSSPSIPSVPKRKKRSGAVQRSALLPQAEIRRKPWLLYCFLLLMLLTLGWGGFLYFNSSHVTPQTKILKSSPQPSVRTPK